MKITLEEILDFDQRKRAHFINSLGGFKSGVLIGTRSVSQQENLAIFNSLFHLGANPPLFGFIIRPDSAPRHTLENIEATKSFTVNHIHSRIVEQAHHTSARYDRATSEFMASGLTPEYRGTFQAPFVKESVVSFSAELQEIHRLAINDTLMVIAKILDVYIPEEAILEDGFVDLVKADTVAISGLDRYLRTEEICRLPYAKPNPQYH